MKDRAIAYFKKEFWHVMAEEPTTRNIAAFVASLWIILGILIIL